MKTNINGAGEAGVAPSGMPSRLFCEKPSAAIIVVGFQIYRISYQNFH
jgi:hypothetical protein